MAPFQRGMARHDARGSPTPDRRPVAARCALALACAAPGASAHLADPTRPPPDARLAAAGGAADLGPAPSGPQLQSVHNGNHGRQVAVIDGQALRVGDKIHVITGPQPPPHLWQLLAELGRVAAAEDELRVRALLKTIVPTYQSSHKPSIVTVASRPDSDAAAYG